MRYKYAFYDMDGTVGDTSEGIFACTEYAFNKLGVKIDNSYESLSRVIGPPLVYAYMNYFGLDQNQAEEAVFHYRQRYSTKGIYEMRLYDGLEQSLKTLKEKGLVMAIVSAKPQEYIDRIVFRYGLEKYFELNVGANMADTHTSKTHLIKRALDYFNINDLNEAVMVGDRKYDLDSAAEIGIDGIGVSYGFGSMEELKGCPNVFIATTPCEISKFIIDDLSE